MKKVREPSITLRGETMKLSDARKYLNKLEKGLIEVQLTDEEKLEYEMVKKPIGFKDERGYLLFILSIPVIMKEREYKVEKCKKLGHLGEKVLSTDSNSTALCYCTQCGDMYGRRMNTNETSEFNKLIKTPYTI